MPRLGNEPSERRRGDHHEPEPKSPMTDLATGRSLAACFRKSNAIDRFHGVNMGIARKVTITVVGILILAELYLVFRPEPDILTAGVASGEAPVTDALQKRFPVGSPASALEAELKREGLLGTGDNRAHGNQRPPLPLCATQPSRWLVHAGSHNHCMGSGA